MGRDPPPVLPGRLAAEEAPAEEAAEVWVRWAVLRLALLLMVLPLLLPRRRRPWVLRLWQRVLWRLLLGLLLGLLLWLLQAVVRRPKEDRGNVAAGDLGEGWQFYLVTLLQPLGGLLWLLLLLWLRRSELTNHRGDGTRYCRTAMSPPAAGDRGRPPRPPRR